MDLHFRVTPCNYRYSQPRAVPRIQNSYHEQTVVILFVRVLTVPSVASTPAVPSYIWGQAFQHYRQKVVGRRHYHEGLSQSAFLEDDSTV